MKFTLSTFTEFGPHCAEFDRLLLQAIRSKSGIEIDLVAGSIQTNPGLDETIVTFSAPHLDVNECSQSVGASVLLPFLENVSAISLSSSDIYSLRPHQRTIADFWARNMYDSIVSSEDLSLIPEYSTPSEEVKRLSSELSKRYLWYLRSLYDEPALSSPVFRDKIYIGSYIPSIQFSTPWLNQGLQTLRDTRADPPQRQPSQDAMVQMIAEFDACRSKLLSMYS